jgi:uncharacterized membrane protein (UPF0127 family)
MIQTRILVFALAGAVLIGSISLFSRLNATVYDQSATLMLQNKEISLTIVNNSETRMRGLSGTESLADNSAMLFVFDESDKYGIWMKDMKFSLDILWLDENKKITHIEDNVSPITYPKVFTPTIKSLYVLEANSDFVEKNNLKVGNLLNFTLK